MYKRQLIKMLKKVLKNILKKGPKWAYFDFILVWTTNFFSFYFFASASLALHVSNEPNYRMIGIVCIREQLKVHKFPDV